jgi:DNA topoisomerase-3
VRLAEQITSPSMTAEWENTLLQIERGKADADKFPPALWG